MKNQKYTWKDLKPFIFNELLKTKHIQTFGTIGSCNVENDIDIIITKKPHSKPSEFYKETKTIFSNLNKYLNKKYNKKVVQFFKFTHQEEILHIGNYKKKDLAIHLMEYLSLDYFFIDWNNIFKTKKELKEFLIKEYNPLFGNLKALFEKEFEPMQKNENIISVTRKNTRFNSNYPKKILLHILKEALYYVQKHSNKKINLNFKSVEDAERNFYQTIKLLEN